MKEHSDDIELAQYCAVRIAPRKGKSAPYREIWQERTLIRQDATHCGCRCGDSGRIIEAICRLDAVEAIEHGFNWDKSAMYVDIMDKVRPNLL